MADDSSPVNQSRFLREYQVSAVSLRFPYKSPKLHKPVVKYISSPSPLPTVARRSLSHPS